MFAVLPEASTTYRSTGRTGGDGGLMVVGEERGGAMEGEEKTGKVEKAKGEARMEAENVVLMWGYLPGATPQRAPLVSPVAVPLPETLQGDKWKDVCGGGCGFAMATTDSGKLITWGSTDDQGQSYLTSGKHEEIPEAFPLDVPVIEAAAGWAHCITISDKGEAYTWGWKECVPSTKTTGDQSSGVTLDKDISTNQNDTLSEKENLTSHPASHVPKKSNGVASGFENRSGGEDNKKRRRISAAKQAPENEAAESDEPLSALPCLVSLGTGVRVTAVAAGGRHTLVLSDIGQVWGWGYGGEGQLGLGTRVRMVSSPHLIPCIQPTSYSKEQSRQSPRKNMNPEVQFHKIAGSSVKAIACGGRHSAVVTDSGDLLMFGWGLHGQCGQGNTDDELRPTCVSSLSGIHIKEVAAGLWHTVCTSIEGGVYAFGGNQFGQLGTGSDQAQTLPTLLETPYLENSNAKAVSCGARHSAIITDDGKVFCWGWNKYGQLGLGDAADKCTPCEVPIDGFRPKNVSCGWWHTLVLAETPA